ncbi:MAG: OmpA family protein [Deltaproteobacteria bacterium]|jgi:outer membrane protein OmpA-like peptidoglycan-associated protein|nr:OmpA family protein [Deltaproteobacteria bacterium]
MIVLFGTIGQAQTEDPQPPGPALRGGITLTIPENPADRSVGGLVAPPFPVFPLSDALTSSPDFLQLPLATNPSLATDNSGPSPRGPLVPIPPTIDSLEPNINPAPETSPSAEASSSSSPEPAGLAPPGQPASPVPAGRASPGQSSQLTTPSKSEVQLDADAVESALSEGGNDEVEISGSGYVWQGNYLYRRNSDGTLTLAEGFLSPQDTEFDPFGREWLTYDGEGNAFIKVSLRVWASINFQYNSDELTEDSEAVLEVFSQALNRPALKQRRLLVVGHTDGQGTKKYNLNLSRRRAAAVARWLIDKGGLDRNRLVLAGYGDTRPIADNDSQEGQAKNRRVEFILLQ